LRGISARRTSGRQVTSTFPARKRRASKANQETQIATTGGGLTESLRKIAFTLPIRLAGLRLLQAVGCSTQGRAPGRQRRGNIDVGADHGASAHLLRGCSRSDGSCRIERADMTSRPTQLRELVASSVHATNLQGVRSDVAQRRGAMPTQVG
jgi:hypothetical protein